MHLTERDAELYAHLKDPARRIVNGDDLRTFVTIANDAEVMARLPSGTRTLIAKTHESLLRIGTESVSLIAGDIADSCAALAHKYSVHSGVSTGREWD